MGVTYTANSAHTTRKNSQNSPAQHTSNTFSTNGYFKKYVRSNCTIKYPIS
jgi:hypothetical protein